MNDILTIQRFVLGTWLTNGYTEKITSVHKRCFDGALEKIYTLIKKQYVETGNVDMINIAFDFATLVEITNSSTEHHFNFDSCVNKLNVYRSEKANRYIGTKLSLGELTESEAIDLLNKKLELSDEHASNGEKVAVEAYQKIIERFESKKTMRTGLKQFDGIIGDLSESGFFVLGGRPSSGKTVLALNIAEAVAKQGKKVLFFSLEMSSHKIMQRILVSNAMVDNEKIKSKSLNEKEFKALSDACKKEHLKNIDIIDKSGMTIDEIITKSASLHKKNNYGVIIIDYLQLMQADGNSIREKMINVSHGCVTLRKMLEIPIIVISSLSRANQARTDKRPVMSDLAEAGAIEFDADTIAFVHRPFIENNEADPCNAEIIFRKNRDGNLGIAKQYFKGEYFKFMNWEIEPK